MVSEWCGRYVAFPVFMTDKAWPDVILVSCKEVGVRDHRTLAFGSAQLKVHQD